MKGVVFTEFLDMIGERFGPDTLVNVLDRCQLESEGAYATIGSYDHRELLEITGELSKHSGIPEQQLIREYGHHLFGRFHQLVPVFFDGPKSSFEFLESVNDYIHVEVKKLYVNAILPTFETIREGDDKLIMIYKSHRPFADFAHGLIQGCIDFYKEDILIEGEDKNSDEQFCRIFTLTRR